MPLRGLARITGAWRRSAPMLAPVDTAAGLLGSVAAATVLQLPTSKNAVPGGPEKVRSTPQVEVGVLEAPKVGRHEEKVLAQGGQW